MELANIAIWAGVIVTGWGAGRWIWDSAEILACEPHVHKPAPETEVQAEPDQVVKMAKNGRKATIAGSMIVLGGLAFLVQTGPATWPIGIALGAWLVALAAIAFSDVISRSMMDYHMILVFIFGMAISLLRFGSNWTGGLQELGIHLLGGLILGLFLWGLGKTVSWRLGQEALGLGDPMLVASMAMALGILPTIASVLLASVLGIIGHTLWHQKKGEHHIPFALYLGMGGGLMALAGLIWGAQSMWLPSIWPNS